MENHYLAARRQVVVGALACAVLLVGAAYRVATAAEAESFRARVDGVDWVATRTLATPTRIGGAAALNVMGFLDAGPHARFGFNLVLGAERRFVGTFPLGPNALKGSHGSFVADGRPGGDPRVDSFRFADGNVTIDRYDETARRIWGRFSGSTKNSDGKTVNVTDGSFAAVEVGDEPKTP